MLSYKSRLFLLSFCLSSSVFAQNDSQYFISQKKVAATPVKDQAMSNTCWSFSTTSLFESQCLKTGKTELDISEMFTVRNIYIEKAKNYLLRQGAAQFGEGGLGHDPVRAIQLYGAVPESAYSGLLPGQSLHNHSKMIVELKAFLDSCLKASPLSKTWQDEFTRIMDRHMGVPPSQFKYNGKQYTPKSFASEVLKFNSDDYVNITSFTHHPYYSSFILEQPDNFSNGAYYNIPLNEMIGLVKEASDKGFSVMWDTDISNVGWMLKKGYAMFPGADAAFIAPIITPDVKEAPANAAIRQELFESLVTVDDHLMHIIGTEKSKGGKFFFIVKNSWGEEGPFNGLMHVSENYFAINTVSLVVPKAAINKTLLSKLGLK